MVVGTAFHESHIKAECEFCGACVSVCPTGTLFEKYRKWAGVPDAYRESICPLCSLNCEVQVAIKKGKVIGTVPPGDPHLSGGELCVKGRFCLAEMVNHPDRLQEPQFRFPEGNGIISREQAFEKAAQQLNAADGKRVAFYLSPNLSLEEYAAVDRFAAEVMNTGNITSSILNENMISFLSLAEKSISLKDVENSGAIIPVFLRGNYHYAPLTLAIKRAAEKGVPLYQVAWTTDTASRFADKTISPPPGKEKNFFRSILNTLEKGKGGSTGIKELVKLLAGAPPAVFVLGPEIADLTEGADILQSIEKIAGLTGAKIFAPDPFGNITGMLSVVQCKSSEEIDNMVAEGKIDLLYLIGDTPFSKRPQVEFIIHQGSFPPPDELSADLVLPTAAWGEITGTYAGRGGTFKKFNAVVEPPGMALINREIFAGIAGAMGKKHVKFTAKEIAGQVPQNPSVKLPGTQGKGSQKANVSPPDPSFPYLLVQERTPHAFHNVSLSKVSAGMAELLPGNTIVLNPGDASVIGLQEGDSVYVESAGHSASYPLKLQHSISPGFVFLLTHSRTHVFKTNPCPVHLRRNNV
jgi:formate dehydrogenase alpha subunit